MREPNNTTNSEPAVVRLAHWFNDYWPRIASAVGTVGIASTGIWFSIKGSEAHWCAWLVFLLSLLAWFIGEVFDWHRHERLSSLNKRLTNSESSRLGLEEIIDRTSRDYFDLFQDQLSILANDVFGLTDRERISVYKHDGTAFVMLGRYSKNPEYCKKGRVLYPDNEGCIATAWKDGEAIIEGLPDPANDLESYMATHKDDWGINKQVIRDFGMKSRSYVALAIEDRLQKRIAVVVFESTQSNGGLNTSTIKPLLESHEGKRIAQFLGRMRSLEPSPTHAQQEGY